MGEFSQCDFTWVKLAVGLTIPSTIFHSYPFFHSFHFILYCRCSYMFLLSFFFLEALF
jgi:hypothetical protein